MRFQTECRRRGGESFFNSFYVVGDYGRAAYERGRCKNGELYAAIRPDFSSIVCIHGSTRATLVERGRY